MANLKTDYKDDILDSTQNLRRKFRMITNDDGTFSFEDVTDYLQYGDSFGALDLNAITNAIMNECLKRTDVVDNTESTATNLPLSANMGRELNDKLEWKLIGSVVGIGNPIYLPTETYSKFLIITGTPVYKWSRHFTKNELNTFVAFNDSYYHPTMITNNSPSAQIVRAIITASNEISLAEVWQNGVKNDESGTLVVYGR